MHYGLEVVPVGVFSDPQAVVGVARAAEAAGWEGLVLWDHVLLPQGAADPWITLAAVAATTERLKLGTSVAPLPRYRPHLLARMLVALDRLSGGRVIFGAGLGVDWDFTPFGEPGDDATRAAMLDEGLELLRALLAGEEVHHRGAHYTAAGVRLVPAAVQQPRIPIWIGGDSPAAWRRAARWDGWIMGTMLEQRTAIRTPAQIADRVARIRAARTEAAPFDIAVCGAADPGNEALVAEYAAAGATWWFESIAARRSDDEEVLRRIAAGPPRQE